MIKAVLLAFITEIKSLLGKKYKVTDYRSVTFLYAAYSGVKLLSIDIRVRFIPIAFVLLEKCEN